MELFSNSSVYPSKYSNDGSVCLTWILAYATYQIYDLTLQLRILLGLTAATFLPWALLTMQSSRELHPESRDGGFGYHVLSLLVMSLWKSYLSSLTVCPDDAYMISRRIYMIRRLSDMMSDMRIPFLIASMYRVRACDVYTERTMAGPFLRS